MTSGKYYALLVYVDPVQVAVPSEFANWTKAQYLLLGVKDPAKYTTPPTATTTTAPTS